MFRGWGLWVAWGQGRCQRSEGAARWGLAPQSSSTQAPSFHLKGCYWGSNQEPERLPSPGVRKGAMPSRKLGCWAGNWRQGPGIPTGMTEEGKALGGPPVPDNLPLTLWVPKFAFYPDQGAELVKSLIQKGWQSRDCTMRSRGGTVTLQG